MDLSPTRTVSQPVDEKLWLGSEHGTDCMYPVTLDIEGGTFDDLIVADPASVAGYGYIPSGTAITKGDDDLYVLAIPHDLNPDTDTDGGGADTDTDGPPVLAECEGHLFESVRVKTGSVTAAGSLLWHGVVIVAQVPNAGFVGVDGAKFVLYR